MSKRVFVIAGVAVGVLIIGLAYGLVGRAIFAERSQQSALSEQIAIVETAVAGQQGDAEALPARRSELATVQAEQATVQAELVSARLSFPSEVDSTEVLAQIVSAAAIYRVNLRQIQARPPTTATIETITYRLFEYEVQVEGQLETVSDFITALESGPVSTLSLDGVDLRLRPSPTAETASRDAPPTATPPPTEGPPLYQASLTVQVYVRMAPPGATPLPPLGTPVPPEERARQLETLVEQAYKEEDWARAISLLLVLRQMRPDDPALETQLVDVYVREGQRRLAAGQLAEAESNFRAALALQPDSTQALDGLALLGALSPTPTPTLSPTPTATPTATPRPTQKPKPTPTPTITPTPSPYYVSNLQFSANTLYPDLGCKWFGFVGKITNAQGYPLEGITVHVGAASWEGVWAVTNLNGEYEIYLDDHPRAERWLVEVLEGGQPMSELIIVDSRADCNATVIQMDWRREY